MDDRSGKVRIALGQFVEGIKIPFLAVVGLLAIRDPVTDVAQYYRSGHPSSFQLPLLIKELGALRFLKGWRGSL